MEDHFTVVNEPSLFELWLILLGGNADGKQGEMTLNLKDGRLMSIGLDSLRCEDRRRGKWIFQGRGHIVDGTPGPVVGYFFTRKEEWEGLVVFLPNQKKSARKALRK